MIYERFCIVEKYFHVFDNAAFGEENGSSDNKLSKLDGLIDCFNKKFAQIYWPEKELSIDENPCSWSGKGGSTVYTPLKPIKYGLKIFALCEAKSCYACNLILYNNKVKEGNLEMILKLTQNHKFLTYHFYIDNFYTSVKILEGLKGKGLYCCGTLRENRGGPKGLKSDINKFRKSEGLIMNNNKKNYLGFKDNGVVQMLSNIHSALFLEDSAEIKNATSINMKRNEIIVNCNKYMDYVNLMYQMIKYYFTNRKSQKWTTKLCFHVLNITFYNTFVLYKKFKNTA
jgi:hypothetical protein